MLKLFMVHTYCFKNAELILWHHKAIFRMHIIIKQEEKYWTFSASVRVLALIPTSGYYIDNGI